MTVLSVASDKEIVAAVAQLRTDTGPSRRIWSNNSCFVESPWWGR